MKYGIDTGFLVAVEVVEHPRHAPAQAKIASLVSAGDEFALAPQVLAEFIHVVTDPRRFSQPLNMPEPGVAFQRLDWPPLSV